MHKLGFIVLRCVRQKAHDRYWLHCVEQIQKFHQEPILIIDDNSTPELLSECLFENVEIIQSEFPGNGEILPYYYLFKTHCFERAIILHDSMFLQKPFEYNDQLPYQFLWYFPSSAKDLPHMEREMLQLLSNPTKLLEMHADLSKWVGCFGACTSITWEFLDVLQLEHNLFDNIFKTQGSRAKRRCFERVLAILCIGHCDYGREEISTYGLVFNHPRYYQLNFDQYLDSKENLQKNAKIIKVWSGR